jgi:hypothetical protein
MTAISPIIHALFVASDQLDAVVDEMPEGPCEQARITLSALARAAQLTAEQLKAEEADRERKLMGVV